MALTDTAARQAKPKEKAYTVADSLGLFLYIAPSGVKSWHFRFTWLGKQARISFGTYPDVGLKDARARRDDAREEVAQGIDPRESRKEKKAERIEAQGRTFRRVYEEWIAFRKGSISPGTLRVISNAMELDALPAFGDKQIDAIKRAEVISLIRAIEKRGAVTQAVKGRQWISQVFRYAIAIGLMDVDPTSEMHAVTAKIDQHSHRPFMDFSEMPKVMKAIMDCVTGHQIRSATLMMIYTASRPGEVRNAEWSEINLNERTWTTPAAKMKMRRDHVVPLPDQAIELLNGMLPMSGHLRYVFPKRGDTTKPIGINYAQRVMDMCGLMGKQSPHGFRHMFSTEMNGRGYNRDWVERQLAHADTSVIRDIYNHATYLDQRRQMMQEWADLISTTPTNLGAK